MGRVVMASVGSPIHGIDIGKIHLRQQLALRKIILSYAGRNVKAKCPVFQPYCIERKFDFIVSYEYNPKL